jgi:hypothetical protein
MANSVDEQTNPISPIVGLGPPLEKQVKDKRHNPNKDILEDLN